MKLRAPVMNDWALERSELSAQLDDSMSGKLSILAAPAGFGKTVLVDSWTARVDPNTAVSWLSLDEQDSDPVRFWAYFVEWLRRVGVCINSRLVAELRTDPSSIEELIAASVNGLAKIERPHIL
ncbi:MAG: hypothetical protein ACR2QO_19245, partial [Acidimicrobiales bacterium]